MDGIGRLTHEPDLDFIISHLAKTSEATKRYISRQAQNKCPPFLHEVIKSAKSEDGSDIHLGYCVWSARPLEEVFAGNEGGLVFLAFPQEGNTTYEIKEGGNFSTREDMTIVYAPEGLYFDDNVTAAYNSIEVSPRRTELIPNQISGALLLNSNFSSDQYRGLRNIQWGIQRSKAIRALRQRH
jgi:hypothetical protein